VTGAIRERFAGEVGEGNVRAAEAAYDHVRRAVRRPGDA
jgi:Pyruvate/2-oxoacid:ferredoxin oxidoreductase gamma subunit